jgi:hypothetical protein
MARVLEQEACRQEDPVTALSPDVYSPTSPYVPQSPFGGATSLFGTSPCVTSPFSGGNVSYILADFSCIQPYFSWIFTHESTVLADLSFLLSDVTSLQSSVSLLQPYLTPILPHQTFFQPCITPL